MIRCCRPQRGNAWQPMSKHRLCMWTSSQTKAARPSPIAPPLARPRQEDMLSNEALTLHKPLTATFLLALEATASRLSLRRCKATRACPAKTAPGVYRADNMEKVCIRVVFIAALRALDKPSSRLVPTPHGNPSQTHRQLRPSLSILMTMNR